MSDDQEVFNGMFAKQEKVLAYHGPAIYEASCLGVKKEDDGFLYFVHYTGWNKSDEWVEENRLLKKTPANLRRQKQVMEEAKDKEAKKKAAMKAAKQTKKRQRNDGIEAEEDSSMKVEINIPIPSSLQKLMIADWERIHRQHKLVPLPREPSVDTILNEFLTSKARKPDAEKQVSEVVNGIRIYFERALPTRLLYKIERPQHDDTMLGTKESATSIYGYEHLLRLFVVMPSLMAQTSMDKDQKQQLIQKVSEFLKFLAKKTEWFAAEYTPMDPRYLQRINQQK